MTDQPTPIHAGEDDLEPRHLISRSDVVLKAGTLMLGAGTSSRRVKAVMRDVASAVDIDRLEAQVTFTEIVATVAWRGIFRTQVAEVTKPGVNAERIALLHSLDARLRPHMRVAEVQERLQEIERRRPLYPAWLLVIVVALACCSICVLNNGGPAETLAVLPAAAAAYWLHRLMGRHQVNLIATMVISTMVASGAFLAVYRLITLAGGNSGREAAGFVAAAIFLVPGFPLVTGGLDVVRLDLEAGIARLAYAGLVMMAMGIGLWTVASFAGISPNAVPALAVPSAAAWAIRVAASFFAVLGWALMFNAPPRVALTSAAIAIVGNVLRLSLLDAGVTAHVATFAGALAIGLLCHWAGWLLRLPVLIMTVPTLLVMIPGAPGVRALMYFNSGDLMSALGNGITVVLQAIAMVAGLAAAMMLTDPEWAFTRPDPPTLRDMGTQLVRQSFAPFRRRTR